MGSNGRKKLMFLMAFLCPPHFGWTLEVLPELIQLRGAPGAHLRAPLTIVNDSASPVVVQLDLQGDSIVGRQPWMRVSPKNIKIKAGKSRVAYVSVRVPLQGGECSAQVRARTEGPMASSEIRIIRTVNVIIAGTENYSLSFESIHAVDQGDRVTLEAGYRNDGNITVRPKMGALVHSVEGTPVSAFQDGSVLPVAPGKHGLGRVVVPLSGQRWNGRATVTAYFLDSAGETRSIDKRVGD